MPGSSNTLTLALLSAAMLANCTASAQKLSKEEKARQRNTSVQRPLTTAQSALIDQAVVQEKSITQILKDRKPMVETYIQTMRPDPVMREVPDADLHFLGRLQLDRTINVENYQQDKANANSKLNKKHGLIKDSMEVVSGLAGHAHYSFSQAGFAQMLLIDLNDFDRQHYNFFFVRQDFLGAVPTSVFDVVPALENSAGRFFGRVWIETAHGNIVRINGEYAGAQKTYHEYPHFDSWRTNVQPGVWLPTSTYIEDIDPKSKTTTLSFKASNQVWGYALKLPSEIENTSIEVENATDLSSSAQDQGPLAAQRALSRQAEDNVLDRLFQAGLLDAPSEFDKTLATLANNILAYNQAAVAFPIRVRTLLTEPLESFAVGNTIVLSKGLIDTSAILSADGDQQLGNLNALLAFQLAHILSGHRLDTQYAFNARLMFPDNMTFRRIPMHHTDADNAEAAIKALELLHPKELAASQQCLGIYLQQLQARIQHLPTLTQPLIGDGLVKSDTDPTFWLAPLMARSGKLAVQDLNQQAAVPLSSFLTFDPWTDQLLALHATLQPILNASDKMPFEVMPVYLKLAYFHGSAPAAGTAFNPATAVQQPMP